MNKNSPRAAKFYLIGKIDSRISGDKFRVNFDSAI